MRKRLIGKAFAVAMSGAMAFTASPLTANIFNIPAIVKAAEDEYVYCYAGLTWNQYWASENVYAAGNDSSSDAADSRGELDKGGYDAVTRATTNHGLHRGSFQCTTVIHAKDADGNSKDFYISDWKDASTLVLTDGTSVSYSKGLIDGKYTLESYNVLGLKYVPVKVKKSDYAAFKQAYTVVENNGTLVGGYAEGTLSSYSETAEVTADTNGLKTAVKNSDGSFSFTARKTGSNSGIKDTAQKKVDSSKIEVTVKPASGSYGEFLRVDLNGAAYGDLGSNMQAVKWTYYGNDSTRSKALATYGTKFAADNWMHKSMGIQLGLTGSDRCQLPSGTDGTGYWSLTIYALGYEDYTVDFEATSENIVSENSMSAASDEERAALSKLVSESNSLKKSSYCKGADRDKAFSDLEVETKETKDLLAASSLSSASAQEQTTHLTEAIKNVKALKAHSFVTITTPATTKKDGSVVVKCKNCGEVKSTKKLAKLTAPAKTSIKLSSAKKTSLKVSWKKVSGASAYQVQYSTSSKFKGAKTVKVSSKSSSKTLTKLKKNKKYYVRVRSYKTVKENKKNKNLYSAWSSKKSLKTKKK